jgi:hypothetical protein
MADRTCELCGKVFRYPKYLREHQKRKTPCAPIVARDDLPEKEQEKPHPCRYCGRRFASETSMYRHVRNTCAIANSDDGMEKLFDHTLQRQNRQLRDEMAQLREQMGEIVSLMKGQTVAPPATALGVAPGGIVQTGDHSQVYQDNRRYDVQINYYNQERCIQVPLELVRDTFATNRKLQEFIADGRTQESPEAAAPYVLEALMNIVRGAHQDPAQRNVYLSSKRADQVLVFCTPPPERQRGQWEVRTLVEAIRHIFDGVADGIHELILDDTARPQLGDVTVAGAVGWVPIHYQDEPDKYVEKARQPMAAHLTNSRAAVLTPPQLETS